MRDEKRISILARTESLLKLQREHGRSHSENPIFEANKETATGIFRMTKPQLKNKTPQPHMFMLELDTEMS